MIDKLIGDILDDKMIEYKKINPKLSEKEIIRLIFEDMSKNGDIQKIAFDEYVVKYNFKQPLIKEAA